MGGHTHSGNLAHDTACNTAESVRQAAQTSAAQSPAGQVALNAAEIVWARACIASCNTNNAGVGKEPYQTLLRALGTGGL
jgi:predicted small secreted protein